MSTGDIEPKEITSSEITANDPHKAGMWRLYYSLSDDGKVELIEALKSQLTEGQLKVLEHTMSRVRSEGNGSAAGGRITEASWGGL